MEELQIAQQFDQGGPIAPANQSRSFLLLEIISLIVFLGGIVGLYLGWVIPFATQTNSSDPTRVPIREPQTYIPIIFITIFVTALLIFFVILFKNNWGKKTFWKQLALFLFVFAIATGMVALASAANIYGIITLGVILLLSPLLLLIPKVRQFFAGIWNPLKGFSGSIFGDVANMVGVLAGIGGAKIFPGSSIYWLGHAGAFLAFLVGASSLFLWSYGYATRQLELSEQDFFDNIKGLWLPGLLNLIVAEAVMLSLLIPVMDNNVHVADTGIPIFWTVIFSLFILLILISFISLGLIRTFMTRVRLRFLWPNAILILVMITNIVVIWAMFVPWSQDAYFPVWEKRFAFIVGIIGAIAWIVAEGASWIDLTKEWYQEGAARWKVDNSELTGTDFHILKYLTWEKNLWQILGGFGLIVYLSADFAEIAQTVFTEIQIKVWVFIFLLGAMFSFVGTIRGILNGVMNRFVPKN